MCLLCLLHYHNCSAYFIHICLCHDHVECLVIFASCIMFIFYYIALCHPCLFAMVISLALIHASGCDIAFVVFVAFASWSSLYCTYFSCACYLCELLLLIYFCSILPSHLNHHQVQHQMTSFFLSILTHLLQVTLFPLSLMFIYFLMIILLALYLFVKFHSFWCCFGRVQAMAQVWIKFTLELFFYP